MWSPEATFETTIERFEQEGYWDGVARRMTTTPNGHALGIVAHNCYEEGLSEPEDNLVATLDRMVAAVGDGADLIEWDVRQASGEWVIQHDDFGGSDAARLEEALALSEILEWDQPLFVEIKERDPTLAGTRELLELFLDAGLAVNGRPLVFRAFQDERIDSLHYLAELIESGDYPLHEHYIRLHVLMADDTVSGTTSFHALIASALDSGFDGIEFNWHTPDLFNLMAFARSWGLGVGLWTVPESMGEAWCASLRDEVDALVVDYDLADCRTVAEEETQLIYLNARDMEPSDDLTWYGADGDIYDTTLGDESLPSMAVRSTGEGLLGPSLEFTSSLETYLPLYDADNAVGEGFLVATTVEFGDLDLVSDEVVAIFSKADAGGFALELVGGWFSPKLRFGVHVAGMYHYADVSVGDLDPNHSHFIMGAYDGSGRVRLWVNNSDGGVDESGILYGGVTQNDVPVLVGADPQGLTDTRYHFTGRVQMAMLQHWRDH